MAECYALLDPASELARNSLPKSKEDASGPIWEFGSSQAPTQMFVRSRFHKVKRESLGLAPGRCHFSLSMRNQSRRTAMCIFIATKPQCLKQPHVFGAGDSTWRTLYPDQRLCEPM